MPSTIFIWLELNANTILYTFSSLFHRYSMLNCISFSNEIIFIFMQIVHKNAFDIKISIFLYRFFNFFIVFCISQFSSWILEIVIDCVFHWTSSCFQCLSKFAFSKNLKFNSFAYQNRSDEWFACVQATGIGLECDWMKCNNNKKSHISPKKRKKF